LSARTRVVEVLAHLLINPQNLGPKALVKLEDELVVMVG
jgi:hypothetical protein